MFPTRVAHSKRLPSTAWSAPAPESQPANRTPSFVSKERHWAQLADYLVGIHPQFLSYHGRAPPPPGPRDCPPYYHGDGNPKHPAALEIRALPTLVPPRSKTQERNESRHDLGTIDTNATKTGFEDNEGAKPPLCLPEDVVWTNVMLRSPGALAYNQSLTVTSSRGGYKE